jgi:hypothetical protein
MQHEEKMDYETVDALMQAESDALNMAQEYYTHSDQSVDQESMEEDDNDGDPGMESDNEFRYYTQWMLETSKLPEEERREMILEEAVYHDPGFLYLQDAFALERERLQFYSEDDLLNIVE